MNKQIIRLNSGVAVYSFKDGAELFIEDELPYKCPEHHSILITDKTVFSDEGDLACIGCLTVLNDFNNQIIEE